MNKKHLNLYEKFIIICSSVVVGLPIPLTLASVGGYSIFMHVVHQPTSQSIWPEVPPLQLGLSTNPGMTTWCVCGCS